MIRERWQRWQNPPPQADFQHLLPTRKGVVLLLWLLTLAVLLNTWLNWQQMHERQRQTDELEQQFVQLARQQEQLIQAAIHLSPQHKQQLTAFAGQAATPFALLDALGQGWSADIALTRLEINTQAQRLNLDLEARALSDAFRFVERLKAQPGVEVNLQQSAAKPNDPMRPVLVKLQLEAG